MTFSFSKYADKAGTAGGRFLSSFNYLLIALLIYIVLCLVMYLVLNVTLGPNAGASFITFDIATGGDPFNFKEVAFSHPVVWVWILVVHAVSWLMVPVLAATAVDAAYRKWEERRLALDMELREEMGRILNAYAGLPKDEADQIAQQFLADSRAMLANKLAEKAEGV
jgi:hypothetical protein